MAHIGFGAEERLNAGIAEEAVDVVIVAEEVLRHAAILKMPPELRRDRLELLDQCIAGFVAGHVERPVCQSARQRGPGSARKRGPRSEEHTSELQSLMRISYAVFCLKKNKTQMQSKTQQKLESHIIATTR